MVSAFAIAAYAVQLSALFISGGILILIGIIWYIVDIHLYIFHKTEEGEVLIMTPMITEPTNPTSRM